MYKTKIKRNHLLIIITHFKFCNGQNIEYWIFLYWKLKGNPQFLQQSYFSSKNMSSNSFALLKMMIKEIEETYKLVSAWLISQTFSVQTIFDKGQISATHLKGMISPKNPFFIHAKHKFYIILIYSSSPRSIFKKLQFSAENYKIGRNKNANFSLTFILFFKKCSYQKIIAVTKIPRHYYYYVVTKGVAVKRSSHQKE